MTKAEQARHKLLVEQLNSWRGRGETDIIIHGDTIVTRSKSQRSQNGNKNLGVVHWKVSHPELHTSLEENYSSVMDWDNTSSFHQATVDLDHLCGPQVMQTMTDSYLAQIFIS